MLAAESDATVLSAVVQAAWKGSFLGKLPPRAERSLLDTAVQFECSRGQVVYRELHRPSRAFAALVVQGLVRVSVSSPQAREVTIRYASSGDVIGLPTVVAGGAPTGAHAVTNCLLVQLQVNTLRHLARTDAAVGWALCEQLADITFSVTNLLCANVFDSIHERVVRCLLELARREGELLIVRATQQDIADAIGSVREVVARALRQLRNDDLIDSKEHRIVLRDLEGLRRVLRLEEGKAPRDDM